MQMEWRESTGSERRTSNRIGIPIVIELHIRETARLSKAIDLIGIDAQDDTDPILGKDGGKDGGRKGRGRRVGKQEEGREAMWREGRRARGGGSGCATWSSGVVGAEPTTVRTS